MKTVSENGHLLESIRLLLLDVDGVLTDGRIVYHADGTESKAFHVRDGLGIRMLMDAGIHVGVITGRVSEALRYRCQNLGITMVFEGSKDKSAVLGKIMEQTTFVAQEIAFVGDDLPDLAVMKRVGVAIAVADAHEMILRTADMTTAQKGGFGAVREVCEAMLKAQGHWDRIAERFQ